MATSSTGVNMLVDHEEGLHLPSCNREPSKCLCTFVSWIWASKPNNSDSGKWMLFPSSQYVDETWNKVKTLLAAGKLGNTAKVAPAAHSINGKAHLICIYTDDHENVADVFRVLVSLRQNRLSLAAVHYKTDDATISGVYATSTSETSEKKHRNSRVSKYTSPKVEATGADWMKGIKLILNNIGPKFDQGLVAEFSDAGGSKTQVGQKRKADEAGPSTSSGQSGELVTIIHNPPQVLTKPAAAKRAKKEKEN